MCAFHHFQNGERRVYLSKMLPLSAALLQVFVLTLFFSLTKQFSLLKKKIRSLLEWIALKKWRQ